MQQFFQAKADIANNNDKIIGIVHGDFGVKSPHCCPGRLGRTVDIRRVVTSGPSAKERSRSH